MSERIRVIELKVGPATCALRMEDNPEKVIADAVAYMLDDVVSADKDVLQEKMIARLKNICRNGIGCGQFSTRLDAYPLHRIVRVSAIPITEQGALARKCPDRIIDL